MTFDYHSAVTIEKTTDYHDVAITQTHLSYEGRPIIHEYTLGEFTQNPNQLIEYRESEVGHYAHLPWVDAHEGGHEAEAGAHGVAASHGAAGDITQASPATTTLDEGFRENGTLYPNYVSPGIHWGMSIDLNTCIGCNACVVACQAENNISVVGKTHVLKAQEMHWLRIDRYFSGMPDDPDSIQTVFQPMMCQHCDNAPCENVCPVAATPHSSEGLNMMTYNRCIGTKYCANNCPYKVRHFNWMDWNDADCFDDNLYEDGRRDDMNDELTRMVLNPDVTVRSRGVMEKCTFCVQRLQDAKLTAKKDGRPLRDGEARTACQQSCPTDAILFGNVNDKSSAIYRTRRDDQKERTYYVLESIHTLPNVSYLANVRNTEVIVAGDEKLDGLMNAHI
jgi:molybdopterin-containing oxidoreductase family iron-sulfur binding subunit